MSSEAQSPLVSQSGLLPKGLTHSLACYFSPSSPAHLRFLGALAKGAGVGELVASCELG